MRIAVISNTPRVGKTYLTLALAHAYSRSQEDRVAVFTNSEYSHITNPLLQTQDKDAAATPGVFKAMLETGSIRGNQLYNYAIKTGKDEVYLFDLFNRKNDLNQNLEFLSRTSKSIESRMVLIDITGDPTSKENKGLVQDCDVVINLFNTDNYSIDACRKFDKDLEERFRKKYIYICTMYDPRILSEKKLSGLFGKGQKDILTFEYNPSMSKLFIDGDYGVFADKLVYGNEELLKMRQDLLAIMQRLYDSEKRKVIRVIKDWPKA